MWTHSLKHKDNKKDNTTRGGGGPRQHKGIGGITRYQSTQIVTILQCFYGLYILLNCKKVVY